MRTTEKTHVSVDKIMAEIKREIRVKGLFDELPAFDQAPPLDFRVALGVDTQGFRNKVQETMANIAVQGVFPVEGNALKRAFKKASMKATRCTTVPMAIRVTETNGSILQCLEYAATVIEQQQAQIVRMNEKLSQLSDMLNQGVVKE